jgi:AcrR family transcriptional regulator
MARPKEFDREQALDAAVLVFGEHGFAGTTAEMLTGAMKIGRQSLYDTFGDKWQLYCSAVDRYCATEVAAHMQMLKSGNGGLEGIRRLIDRVVLNARSPCLGTNSISEFGRLKDELVVIRAKYGKVLQKAIDAELQVAQSMGEVTPDFDRVALAEYVVSNITALRVSARGGMDDSNLQQMGRFLIRALN